MLPLTFETLLATFYPIVLLLLLFLQKKRMERPLLFGLHPDDISSVVLSLGGTTQHVRHVCRYLYRSSVWGFDQMDDLPKWLRAELAVRYQLGVAIPVSFSQSADATVKYLFAVDGKGDVEAAYMPGAKRNTLCVSTQVGCRMGCSFCMTGTIGFKGNLSASHILNQLRSIPQRSLVNRLVLMGMGEPLDNWDEVKLALSILTSNMGFAFGAANITLSTVGLHGALADFLSNPPCNLAISLHSPFPNERFGIMPIERNNPITQTIEAIKQKPLPKPLRVSFEYVALGGVNTTPSHAKALGELLSGLRTHINIIPWNQHENAAYSTPHSNELQSFIEALNRSGVIASIRESRGRDIAAACGQMAGRCGSKH